MNSLSFPHFSPALALAFWLGLVGLPLRAQFPPEAVLDPGDLALPGVVYRAIGGSREVGAAVAAAGDVNRDRQPDLLVGAPGEGATPGRVFLILSPPPGGRLGAPLQPSAAIRRVITGSQVGDRLGVFVAGPGDVDGDGFDDVLLGASGAHGTFPNGAVYLLFGGSQFSRSVSLGDRLAGQAVGFALPEGPAAGLTGAGVGDINGDGANDFAVGLPGYAVPRADGAVNVGKVLVIFGGAHLRAGADERSVEATALDAGYVLDGVVRDGSLGTAIAALGDIDLDGTDDFALGAPGAGAGAVYIVFGTKQPAAIPDLLARDGVAAVLPSSEALGAASFGAAIAGALDATGDGVPDLLVGAPRAVNAGTVTGMALLVPGGAALRGGDDGAVSLEAAVALVGTRGSRAGTAVALVPDVGGDGSAEILIGAPNRRAASGAAYLISGQANLPGRLFLADDATALLGQQAGIRLGAAVAGLADRSGDGRGELVLGAPGRSAVAGDGDGSGLVYELFSPATASAQAPRELRARLLEGGRVLLTWSPGRDYRLLRVFRDGQDISGRLPGTLQHFVDTSPGVGRPIYEVEAENDAGLRSGPAEILLAPIPVRNVLCRQVEGTTRILVRWSAADFYAALQVLLDGQPASPLLSPNTHEFVLDATAGPHIVEVIDPILDPDGLRAGCTVEVVVPVVPPIRDFACEAVGPHRARLTWTAEQAYAGYIVSRNGVPVGEIQGRAFLDTDAPAGEVTYEVRGVQRGLHIGPPVRCTLEIGGDGRPAVRGRVAFADRRGTPIRRGRIRVFNSAGAPVGAAQPGRDGTFAAPVVGEGPFRLVFEVELPGGSVPDLFDLTVDTQVLAVARDDVLPGDDVELLIGVPILVVATRQISGENARERWSSLRGATERVVVPGEGTRLAALIVPLAIPPGIARGALLLNAQIEVVGRFLAAQLGDSPDAIDLVGYGAAGLAARVLHASSPHPFVRKLVLIGTPNLGTARSELETRGELAGRPLRLDALSSHEVAGFFDTALDASFFAAAEQSAAFLAELNPRLATRRGTEVHLVAGTGGRRALDAILGCGSHDDRVCEDSALGAIDRATFHSVGERHELLGRGPESVALLLEISGVFGPTVRVDRAEIAAVENAQAGGRGGGAGVESSSLPGQFYSGVVEPGGAVELLMVSDTSDSIIVVLNSKLPGGIELRVQRPDGESVDPAGAGALPAVTYFSYGDGEGHEIQAYEFRPSAVGSYLALLENPAGDEAIEYTLEMYLESDITLAGALVPETLDVGEEAVVEALLQAQGEPITDAFVEATVWRPDGAVEVFALFDDGENFDQVGGDGIYTGVLTAAGQPGVHSVAVMGTHGEMASPPFRREELLQMRVQSDVAQLAGELSSGTLDPGEDGRFDSLWLTGEVTATTAGTFFVAAELAGASGEAIATASALISAVAAGAHEYRLDFDGFDIYTSGENGPYVVSRLELFDGSVGLVLADQQFDAHVTEFFEWNQFGLSPGVAYIRGDTNADLEHDISDAIAILEDLFTAAETLHCDDAADGNGDGFVDVGDASFLLNFLFLGAEPPAAPYPTCGFLALLGCEEFTPCEE